MLCLVGSAPQPPSFFFFLFFLEKWNSLIFFLNVWLAAHSGPPLLFNTGSARPLQPAIKIGQKSKLDKNQDLKTISTSMPAPYLPSANHSWNCKCCPVSLLSGLHDCHELRFSIVRKFQHLSGQNHFNIIRWLSGPYDWKGPVDWGTGVTVQCWSDQFMPLIKSSQK